jgi:hypothetical protein
LEKRFGQTNNNVTENGEKPSGQLEERSRATIERSATTRERTDVR